MRKSNNVGRKEADGQRLSGRSPLDLSSELRDFEAQIRTLQPRSPRLDESILQAVAPARTTRSQVALRYVATWVSGVAVGCLIMATMSSDTQSGPTGPSDRGGPSGPSGPSEVSSSFAVQETVPSEEPMGIADAQLADVRRTESRLLPAPTVVDVESMLGGSLLASSHLRTDTVPYQEPSAEFAGYDVGATPAPSETPKSRHALMVEMLNRQHLHSL